MVRRAQMDHASDFVGRSLYVLESAAMEAFRPVEGTCRLDASLEVNKTYMAAMFRHMQVCTYGGRRAVGLTNHAIIQRPRFRNSFATASYRANTKE